MLQMRGEYKHDDEEATPVISQEEEIEEIEDDDEESEESDDEGSKKHQKKDKKQQATPTKKSDEDEIKKLSPDELRSLHSMAMTEELLEHTNKKLNNAGIHGLLRNVILRHISHTNPLIRARAIHCLGLFCMLDKV